MSEKITRPNAHQNPKIDPREVAHHLRVAADKYHEIARGLIERMSDAVAAVPDRRKNSIREGRESLAKLFDEQASDALRLSHIFDDLDQCELDAALGSIASANARKVAEESDLSGDIVDAVRDVEADVARGERLRRLVAGKVSRPAIPEGRATPACDNELMAAISATARECAVCRAALSAASPGIEGDDGFIRCRRCGATGPAGENDGSLQHTPTTWIGNEQVNRPLGGEA